MNDTKNPTQWLTNLLAEVELFDAAAYPPRVERAKDESTVGECPEGLRKLYAFSQYCEREIEQAKLDRKFASKDEQDEISTRVGVLNMKQDTCETIFMGCLTDYFDDWDKRGHFHIRENWEVVRCKKCGGPPSLPDFMRGFGFQIGGSSEE